MEEDLKMFKCEVNKDVLQNWTKKEKFHLYQAIKTYGSHDIERVQEHILTKSVEETKAALEYYKQKAQEHPILEEYRLIEKAKDARKSREPLTGWAKLLTENININELRTETATAVRMIADLENLPLPVFTDNINFKEIYHQIANALEGKEVQPDMLTAALLHKCVVETTLASKAFMKTSSLKYILNNIDLSDKELSDKEINMFPRPADNEELAVLRHLAAQRSYNPLKIPEHVLKPSCDGSYEESTTQN